MTYDDIKGETDSVTEQELRRLKELAAQSESKAMQLRNGEV